MKDQTNPRDNFVEVEEQIGINRQLFARKFVYSGETEGEGFLLQRFKASPSQFQGFSIDEERLANYLMSEMVFKAAQSLKLPVSTAVVASVISHYFYGRVGLLDYDFRDVVMGALFLACKSEETLRKSWEVSSVCDFVFKVFEGQRMPIKVQVLDSEEYKFMKQKTFFMQRTILFELGFEVHRLFDIPHRYIGGLFKSLDRHPRCKAITQKAWTTLNDLYKTNCCLYYPGQVMAAASIHYAFLKLGIKVPTVPWWVLMEANIDSIQAIIAELEALYESAAGYKYSLPLVAAAINNVGQQQGLVNVFPVHYYRKITLEVNKQLRIPKLPTPPPSLPPTPPPSPLQTPPNHMGDQKADESEEKRIQKKERKDKKDKKEKKEKKQKKEKKEKREKEKKKKHKERRKRDQDEESRKSRSRSRERRRIDTKMSEESRKSSHHELDDSTPKASVRDGSQSENRMESEEKQTVRQMKVGSAKGLLSMISSQLKQHSQRLQKQAKHAKKSEPKSDSSDSDDEKDEDELMAELIEVRKKNMRNQ